MEHLFGAFALGNILDFSNHHQRLALRIPHQTGSCPPGDDDTVAADIAFLQLVTVDNTAHQGVELYSGFLPVIGVRDTLDRQAGEFFGGITENIAERRVDVEHAAIQPGCHNTDGGIFQRQAQLFLALPELPLGLLP